MSQHENIVDLEEIQAPWNKQVSVQETTWEGGFKMIRLRIKEGRRFTDLELDSATADRLAEILKRWVETQAADGA